MARDDLFDAVRAVCAAPLAAAPSQYRPNKRCCDAWTLAEWDRDGESDGVFWLECRVSEATTFADTLEAATLFAAVARVDRARWKALATELWSRNHPWADVVATRTALSVGVAIVVDDKYEDIADVAARVVSWLQAPRSHAYTQARERLATLSEVPVVPLQLNCRDYSFEEVDVATVLENLRGVVSRQPTTTDVCIAEVKTGSWELSVDGASIESLAAIRALGIHVADLPITGVQETNLNRHQCLQYVRPLLDADATETNETRRLGVERIVVSTSMPEAVVRSVSSAIHASRSLRSVEVVLDAARQPVDTIHWLAYALFYRTPLDVVNFNDVDKLRMGDVDAMRQLLTAADPLAVLVPEESSPTPSRVVTTSEAFLSHPRDFPNASRWTESAPSMLQMLGKSRKGHLPVLLPGWGKAWVQEDHGHAIDAPQPTTWHSPTRLVLQSVETISTPATLAFVRLIGHNLKRLELNEFGCGRAPLDDFCREVFTACPHLEELEVATVQLRSLQFLLDAIEAGECRALTRLTFFSIELADVSAIETLFSLLGDPTSLLAMQLHKLYLHVSFGPDIATQTMDLAVRMLQRNTVLRDVVLGFTPMPTLASYKSQLEELSGEILGDPMPLPLRSVLAFLSVGTRDHGQRNAMQRLDSVLFRRILGFAGTRRVRSVEAFFD